MKRLSFASVLLPVICGFLFSQTGGQVYIAGVDGFDAVYWLNGQRYVLPTTGEHALAFAIAVSR
jgi:hypothetical protein